MQAVGDAVSRQAVKFTVGEAHHIARVLTAQGRPKPAQEDRLYAWITLFETGRCKLEPADCRRLVGLMSAVCQPVGAKQQADLASIVKRLSPIV